MVRSAGCVTRTFVVACACALSAVPLEGQWRLDAQAGRLQYDAVSHAATTSISLAVSRSTLNSSFGLTTGLPFASDEPVWGALFGQRRFVSGTRLQLGVDLSGNAFGYRIAAPDTATLGLLFEPGESVTGWGAAAEIMPLLAWQNPLLRTELRAGAAAISGGSTGESHVDRLAFTADALLATNPIPGAELRGDVRWVSAPEGDFQYAGAAFTWSRQLTIWGSIGKWLEDDVALSWSAGAYLPLGDRIALSLNGRREPIDPVYDVRLSRTTWGAGLTVWIGDRATIAEPIPTAYRDGVATIGLDTDGVTGTPSIAGDFNEWTPTPMEREGDSWILRLPLAPGVYNYAFVDENGDWFVPEDTPGRRSDGMGGYVAVLIVGEE